MKEQDIIEILNAFGYDYNMNELKEALNETPLNKNGKCVLFSRVSTVRQDLKQQNDELYIEAKRNGYDEADIILIEQKESAISLDEEERIGIKRLYDTIDSNKVDCVIVYEISRIARRPDVLYSVRNILIEKQINLICIKPYMRLLDNDGKMSQTASILFSLFGSLSESEMMIKKERFARGKKNKMMENKYIGGSVLFGYKVNKDNDAIEIDEQDKNTVIEIFERYLNNESIRSIAIDLMDRGLLRYSGYETARCMIADMIKKPEYTGERTTNYQYPAIISKQMFDAAQKRKKKIRTNNTNIYYCKGLIHWKLNGHILAPMVSQMSYGTHDGFLKTELMLVNMNLMDSLVYYTVIKHRDKMKGSVRKKTLLELTNRMERNNQKSQKITEDIDEINDIIDRINERIVKGKITEKKGDMMIDNEHKRFEKLTTELRAIVNENKELDRQLEKIMKGDNMDYEKLDDSQIYTIIHDDVETINIDKDYEHRGGKFVEIIFKDTTIYKYHLLKYGNYDRIYIIDNNKEKPLDDLKIIKRFSRKY